MTFIYFILILGITVFIHELGHFIFAKKAGIYVYEFALGMGPRIYSFKRKNDETTYSVRLFPIGGFVQMAGESVEDDNTVPKEKRLYSKTWTERFLTIIAGVVFNFILALVILFSIGLINGTTNNKPIILGVKEGSQAEAAGIEKDDIIIKINNVKIISNEHALLELAIDPDNIVNITILRDKIELNFEVEKEDNKIGIAIGGEFKKGFIESINYAFTKTFAILHQMVLVIWYLIIGKLKLSTLAGPLGIYSIVGDAAKYGILNLMYLNALISINVGFINLLPIPAFDGGRLLFLVIEKIKGKPVDPKVENIVHTIGFAFLMILMVLVTFNDIIRLFK
jgi:regulator of sigma E protease